MLLTIESECGFFNVFLDPACQKYRTGNVGVWKQHEKTLLHRRRRISIAQGPCHDFAAGTDDFKTEVGV
ncbi:MAG: hypothetical protein ACD_39C00013G0001 [uncultured bacterium]|nr:MAG: hypothetical protein ACD_39C00013G0001 [uncultured bacterium]